MKRIGLISDTHGYLDPVVLRHFEEVDEIWHAGDFGTLSLAGQLSGFRPLRGVYGNIDNGEIRRAYPLDLEIVCEGVKVFMTHIGGYPGRYDPRVRKLLEVIRPKLFISGHSHICKVMRDQKLDLLHINPGAAGEAGFHKMKTIMRLSLDKGKMFDLEVIELGKRGALK